MEGGIKFIKQQLEHILDLFFPENCLGCHNRGQSLCDTCILQIRQAERETEHDILAVYDYRDLLIKKVIWNLKYYHKINLGQKLGKLLYEALIEDISDIRTYASGQPIYIIPVPISHKRRRGRGYNQAEIIARGFISASDKNAFELRNDIVYKKYDTKPQARIVNKTERLRNIKKVFEIKNKDMILGRTIIIIDDVTTTGGTINEIIKVLKKNGAKKVIGFAVAH